MEIISILTKVKERKKKREEEKKVAKPQSKGWKAKKYFIGGDELIRDKLSSIIPKLHKDVQPLLRDRDDIVGYKETSHLLEIKFEDKSTFTVKFGADHRNHYKYVIDGKAVIDDYA